MWDYHMHTAHSEDSKEPMENMVRACREKGIKDICITEHCDTDWPHGPGKFMVNIDEYQKELMELR
ncbi:PHP domain-containing protein, partial [Clostridia bacterium OttesenSCG-928-F22]|nr:PHP domain-containing protein [Clostridia bacterium OttesenSCG-928-F22]